MNTLYGIFRRREEGLADSLAGMGASVADCGVNTAEWTAGGVALGARYPAARQACAESPLRFDHEAGLAVAADARLDDRDTLCNALGVPHPERAAIGDGDLILRAYTRWGRDCPNHLLGDYAFAVSDARQRLVFCARDHIGARPFYYASTAEGWVFASAVEAILAAPGVSNDLDETTLAEYLTRVRFTSATHTFFRMVRKLPPGHTLTVEPARLCPPRLERYWYPEQTPRARPATNEEYAEELFDLSARAVKDRLRGGVVGTHLSGGLDSSGVTVLAARELRSQNRMPPPAFSLYPPPGRTVQPRHQSEYARIDAVCAQEELRVTHCGAFSPSDFVDATRRDFAYPHAGLTQESVLRHAERQGVSVVLSGLGGDHAVSFNGLGYEESLLLRGRWLKLAAEFRAHEEHSLRRLARIVLRLVHPRLPWYIAKWREGRRPSPGGGRWLIHPAFARRANPGPDRRIFRTVSVRRMILRTLLTRPVNRFLEGAAASGARCGIEYRYPLLDRRLIEFAVGLPAEQFRRGRETRCVMRAAFSSVLPPEVCWNQDKASPTMTDHALEVIVESLPALRREVAARAGTAERARYIDIPRLLERLDDADRFRARPRFSPISKALAVLDF